MKFADVSINLLKIEKEASRNEIIKILADMFKLASAQEAQILSYLVLGQIRADYQNNKFNFAAKGALKSISELLNVSQSEVLDKVQISGDLGTSLGFFDWPFVSHDLSLMQVYDFLLKLESLSGVNSQQEKSDLFKNILRQMDLPSAICLTRIVLGVMRLGFSDMTLIDSFSWMISENKSNKKVIESAYNLCADIGLIAFLLKDQGIKALENINPKIGIPIRMAGAERLNDPEEIIKKLADHDGKLIVQPKLDGFRLQIHFERINNQLFCKFFSRNLQDMSEMFPEIKKSLGAMLGVENFIVEGEAIVLDEISGKFLPFQETVKRKRKYDIEEFSKTFPLKLYLFDILYLNSESVMNKSCEERKALLDKHFSNDHHKVVSVIDQTVVASSLELEDCFLNYLKNGLEGIVAKKTKAHYEPGKRNFNWVKLKKHESRGLLDTIDVVLLGYYYGEGKRSNFKIGALLVGVYNNHKDCFQTIAKIGTGLSDEDWKEIKVKADEIAVLNMPHNVEIPKELMPDVLVNPEIVMIVAADEITISPVHTAGKTSSHGGFALRFPRFLGYSVDKKSFQATNIEEIRKMHTSEMVNL